MAVPVHGGAWSEEDLAALPEDGGRYELLEGSVIVNPPPSVGHQLVSFEVASLLKRACPRGLLVVEAVGVRLPDNTMFVPDVLVVADQPGIADHSHILEAAAVRLVVEIVSPGSKTKDRLTKPVLYARAGIASYWRVETEGGLAVFAYRLEHGSYAEIASARGQEVLAAGEPFLISLRPSSLRP
ncbi:MAG: Uma2 family endonuclease [Acidimicrobiales bacterium]